MRLKATIIVIASVVSSIVYSQEPKAIETLAKVESYYKANTVLDIEITYNMFKGHTGNNLTESYTGTIYKNDDVNRVKILGSEIIQFIDKHITVDNENKTISYNTLSKTDTNGKSPLDVSTLLKYYKETSTELVGSTIIHVLELEQLQLPLPYHKVEIHIDKNNYSMVKQVLYLSRKMPFLSENGKYTDDVGRMEISFKKNPKPTLNIPVIQDYIILESDKTPRLAQNYSTYTIINQTN